MCVTFVSGSVQREGQNQKQEIKRKPLLILANVNWKKRLLESVNPLSFFYSIHRNWFLIWLMTKREFTVRYRGSLLGVLWAVFSPLILLVIYTFIFTVVFRARFQFGPVETSTGTQFGVMVFTGLVIFSILSETLNRAPLLIISNVNYVKRVVFPLEILNLANLGATLFQAGISFLILIIAIFFIFESFPLSSLFFPLILIPYIFFNLGVSWFLASIAVYIRDVRHIMGILTTALLFLSPIFYPAEAIPPRIRQFIYLNPLTYIIEETRAVLVLGDVPDVAEIGLFFIGGLACMWLGWIWFQLTRRGFADVL